MTVVAAIAREGRVVMAADRQTNYAGQAVFGARKIRRVQVKQGVEGQTDILLAASGNGALPNVLAQHLKVDAPAEKAGLDELIDWAGVVASAVTQVCAGTEPPLLEEHQGQRSMDGALLLGHAGHLFYLFTHQAVHVTDGIAALGSGSEVALGAMHTALELGLDPNEATQGAVHLGVRFMDGCGLGPTTSPSWRRFRPGRTGKLASVRSCTPADQRKLLESAHG